MKPRSKHLLKSVFVISGMLVGLVLIIYAMQYVRGTEFKAGLELFLNPQSQKSWAWCPEGTTKTEWANPKDSQTWQPQPTEVCIISMEPAQASESEIEALQPLIVALAAGHKRILESNAQMELFRIDGLPFKSQGLTNLLKKRGSSSDQK